MAEAADSQPSIPKSPKKIQNFEKPSRSPGQGGFKHKSSPVSPVVVQNDKKYFVKRRALPKQLPLSPTNIYVGEKSNFKAQVVKCQKLLDGKYNEIFLNGLGVAIPKTINVALELKRFYQGTVDYSTTTSTIQLIDDLIPQDESTPASAQSRKVSCINIRVFRTVKIP